MNVPTLRNALFAIVLATTPALALTGCEEQGPLEKAGEAADDAVKDTKRAIKDATK
ncbi:MAG: hypothetical protein ACPGRZ_11935 [Alphaproteobacteria bacterium]